MHLYTRVRTLYVVTNSSSHVLHVQYIRARSIEMFALKLNVLTACNVPFFKICIFVNLSTLVSKSRQFVIFLQHDVSKFHLFFLSNTRMNLNNFFFFKKRS